ncbi:MAG TPA: hypothetical protein PLK12_10910, partial [Prolixibacteraceae bacterium]|nr:hypothetical protein [Prolixibacteraceae bacterium]
EDRRRKTEDGRPKTEDGRTETAFLRQAGSQKTDSLKCREFFQLGQVLLLVYPETKKVRH